MLQIHLGAGHSGTWTGSLGRFTLSLCPIHSLLLQTLEIRHCSYLLCLISRAWRACTGRVVFHSDASSSPQRQGRQAQEGLESLAVSKEVPRKHEPNQTKPNQRLSQLSKDPVWVLAGSWVTHPLFYNSSNRNQLDLQPNAPFMGTNEFPISLPLVNGHLFGEGLALSCDCCLCPCCACLSSPLHLLAHWTH